MEFFRLTFLRSLLKLIVNVTSHAWTFLTGTRQTCAKTCKTCGIRLKEVLAMKESLLFSMKDQTWTMKRKTKIQ